MIRDSQTLALYNSKQIFDNCTCLTPQAYNLPSSVYEVETDKLTKIVASQQITIHWPGIWAGQMKTSSPAKISK